MIKNWLSRYNLHYPRSLVYMLQASEYKIFDYLTSYNECILEKEVFEKLVEEKQITVFEHFGFWQCLDNEREYLFLNQLSSKNSEFWLNKHKHD